MSTMLVHILTEYKPTFKLLKNINYVSAQQLNCVSAYG